MKIETPNVKIRLLYISTDNAEITEVVKTKTALSWKQEEPGFQVHRNSLKKLARVRGQGSLWGWQPLLDHNELKQQVPSCCQGWISGWTKVPMACDKFLCSIVKCWAQTRWVASLHTQGHLMGSHFFLSFSTPSNSLSIVNSDSFFPNWLSI